MSEPTPADEERGEYEQDPYYERDELADMAADRYERAMYGD